MRTEVKISLILFASDTALKLLLSTSNFISGLLLGLSLFYMTIGLLPKSAYAKFKEQHTKKLSLIKRFANLN